MKIGKQISFVFGQDKTLRNASIIWVHPENRFCVAEYSVNTIFGVKKLRECKKIINGVVME